MLNHIAIGAVAEQPAGKGAPPFAVTARPHVQLHESAGFLHILPRRGRFARLQADDGVADTQRFARLHRQVAGQAVALVQKADDGGSLRHRRAGNRFGADAADRAAFDLYRAGAVGGGHVVAAAGRQRQQEKARQDRQGLAHRGPGHAASGLHAS
ncbi:hypothetical protein SAMIE_1000170 [Sphingobium amiense]|uniref:Uncharacterized protein n=1 Tax=Sphingobium amiense TaxID=135719 RepID=A0A494VZG1_9SPHN|nr:hypothetical protein SAMIE_1000170 [Sphingobium amiense]